MSIVLQTNHHLHFSFRWCITFEFWPPLYEFSKFFYYNRSDIDLTLSVTWNWKCGQLCGSNAMIFSDLKNSSENNQSWFSRHFYSLKLIQTRVYLFWYFTKYNITQHIISTISLNYKWYISLQFNSNFFFLIMSLILF
jgi:hypothetical protein